MAAGIKQKPTRKYTVICFFVGHGIVRDCMQEILLNQFDEKDNFYKSFEAERTIRDMSKKYSNAYMVTLFACSRQLRTHIDASNCFPHAPSNAMNQLVEETKHFCPSDSNQRLTDFGTNQAEK